MPRKPSVIPLSRLELKLPLDLITKLNLHLWSEVEGRVPYGEYRNFFEARLREYFSRDRIDIAEIVPGITPGMLYLFGETHNVAIVRRYLNDLKEFSNDSPAGRNETEPVAR